MRRSRSLSLLVIACMCASMLAIVAPASANVPAMTMTRVTNDMLKQNRPQVSGDWIVWRSMDGLCEGDNSGNWDVYAYNIKTREMLPVCTQAATQNHPTINGNIIAWMDRRNEPWYGGGDIYMYDLNTRTESVVCTAPGEQCKVTVGDGFIAWVDDRSSETPTDTGTDIYMYDIATGIESVVCTDTTNQYCVSANGKWVVWRTTYSYPDEIWMYDTESKESTLVGMSTSQYAEDPRISEDGRYVAWYNGWSPYEISYKDMESGETTVVPLEHQPYGGLGLSGDRIVYEYRGVGTGVGTNVGMWDISEATESIIASDVACQGAPDISGDTVVWHDERWKIFLDEDGDGPDPAEDDPRPEICYTNLAEIVTTTTGLAGTNRYQTAIAACQDAFPDGAETVVIATGENWPDALGGAALAGAYRGPILLTNKASLPDGLAAELTRLGAKNAFVLGSEAAVSDAVFDQLDGLLSGSVTRIGGTDRYATANMVAAQAVAKMGAAYGGKAFVATGLNYPDALAASPVAYKAGMPVFLAGKDGPSTQTQLAMMWNDVDTAVYLGGAEVNPMPASSTGIRLAGLDRYGTAVKVADWATANAGMSWCNMNLTTGQNFPDALAGGAVAGQLNTVMLLTKSDSLPLVTSDAIEAHAADITQVIYLGGDSAIDPAVRSAVEDIILP